MKTNVFRPLARPSTRAPTKKPIEMPNTLNSLTFVNFCSNLPTKSNKIAMKNHIPHREILSIVTNFGISA